MSMLNVFQIAGSALSAQSLRMNAIASNMANAETVADENGQVYRAKKVVFAAALADADGKYETLPASDPDRLAAEGARGVRALGVFESTDPARLKYDPGHPMANEAGYVETSNVNIVEEMVDMIAASRSYQNNVEVMNTAKQLMQKTLGLAQG